ncbi:DOMON domain-containing protein [Aphelenchoides fujianensis]|nr:DOMON domain-containing protein [Aphelenchoides fujianensis]
MRAVVGWTGVLPLIAAHIQWLSPEANRPHFDSLNNFANPRPCGLPLDNTTKYDLFVVGREYEGGMQINLLSANGSLVERVAPKEEGGEFFDTEGLQEQNRTIKFEVPCAACQLQILKQAKGAEGRLSLRLLCPLSTSSRPAEEGGRRNDETECHSNGEWKPTGCVCDSDHDGENCQLRVDCETDEDCGEEGECREQPNSAVQRVCFCSFGRFGRNCEFESKLNETDRPCFNADGESNGVFLGYGLFDESCYEQTALTPDDFVYSRVVGEELEIILDFGTVSYAAIGWRPADLSVDCRKFPLVLPSSSGDSVTESAFKAPLHPMSCIDLVWGMVVNGSKLHIRDGYSRGDVATPLPDDHLPGGRQSLTAAFGREVAAERTVVMFRRRIASDDPADHSLAGHLFGVFAKGQPHGERKWVVKEALEGEKNRDRVFFRADEFAYHGGKRAVGEITAESPPSTSLHDPNASNSTPRLSSVWSSFLFFLMARLFER